MIFLGSVTITAAQPTAAQGIKFFNGNWKSLLKESARQRKPIFVDVYTDWCVPCKRMESEVFTLKAVAQIYNSSFISYRLNAERGEGIKLAGDYGVKAYPTYLFLDSLGNLFYRSGDYLKASDFINEANAALKQNSMQDLQQLETRFKSGDRGVDFLRMLIKKRSKMGRDNVEVLNAYISTVPVNELSSVGSLLFLSENIGSTPSNALPFVMKNISKLGADDQRKVAGHLYNNLLYYALGNAIKENRLKDASILLSQVDAIRPVLAEKDQPSADNLALHYFKAAKDIAGLKKIGYRIAEKQMAVPPDSIKARDQRLYEKAMRPFLNGQEDSTRIPNFQEEKKLAGMQYAAGIATNLYTVSDFFKQTLDAKDRSLRDALKWMQFASSLYKKESIERLRDELKAITGEK